MDDSHKFPNFKVWIIKRYENVKESVVENRSLGHSNLTEVEKPFNVRRYSDESVIVIGKKLTFST